MSAMVLDLAWATKETPMADVVDQRPDLVRHAQVLFALQPLHDRDLPLRAHQSAAYPPPTYRICSTNTWDLIAIALRGATGSAATTAGHPARAQYGLVVRTPTRASEARAAVLAHIPPPSGDN